MVHYHNDYIWGKEQEDYTYPILKAYFKTDLKQYTSQYDDFDFYDEESDYEQKSRKNTYSAFDETMITLNKTQKATDKKIKLVFNFTDGIYWIVYDEALFAGFRRESFSRANLRADEKDHIYIPIHLLTLIKKKAVAPQGCNPALLAMMQKCC
jgi:hypothetical protein